MSLKELGEGNRWNRTPKIEAGSLHTRDDILGQVLGEFKGQVNETSQGAGEQIWMPAESIVTNNSRGTAISGS